VQHHVFHCITIIIQQYGIVNKFVLFFFVSPLYIHIIEAKVAGFQTARWEIEFAGEFPYNAPMNTGEPSTISRA
jgi:hypothetical protein